MSSTTSSAKACSTTWLVSKAWRRSASPWRNTSEAGSRLWKTTSPVLRAIAFSANSEVAGSWELTIAES